MNPDAFIELATRLQKEGKCTDEVREHLIQSGATGQEADAALRELRNLHFEKCKRIGIPLIVLGALLCIGGFLATFLLSQQDGGFNFALYGMTGAGATSLVGGLAILFG